MHTYETLFISQYKECGITLFNKASGGPSATGYKHTDEWRRMASLRQKGIQKRKGAKHSKEANERKRSIMAGNKRALGHKQTQEEKEKKRQAMKRFYENKKLKNA
jgi:hypothetical protein